MRLKKKLAVPLLAAILLLTVAAVAVAATGPAFSPAPAGTTTTAPAGFTITGQVERVFTTAAALKVHVRLGSAAARQYLGRDLTLRVGGKAEILAIDDGMAHLITLAKVKRGDNVTIDGWIDRGVPTAPVYVAKTIKVRHWVAADQLAEFAAIGPVTALDTTAGSVTLTVRDGSRALWEELGAPLTVAVTADTCVYAWENGVRTPIAFADVKVGDVVRVAGTIDRTVPAAPVFTADVLVVRQPAPLP